MENWLIDFKGWSWRKSDSRFKIFKKLKFLEKIQLFKKIKLFQKITNDRRIIKVQFQFQFIIQTNKDYSLYKCLEEYNGTDNTTTIKKKEWIQVVSMN